MRKLRDRPPFLIPDRLDETELLDLGEGSPADVAANLREMERINHWLGGVHALTSHLFPLLESTDGEVTIVDAGTGGGGLLRHIRRWADSRAKTVRLIGVDWSGRVLRVADHSRDGSRMHLLLSDARRLPLRADSVDIVTSSLLLHHFKPVQVVTFLRESMRAARVGLVMSDLERGWIPYFAFRLAQPAFARNFLTRIDGARSIRRAYLPAELLDIARSAGLTNARVVRHFPWRMTLVVCK